MNPSGGLQPGQQRSTVVSPRSPQSVIAAAMDTGAIGGAGSLDADLEGTAAVIAAEERQARDNARIAQETQSHGRVVKFAIIAVLVLVGVTMVVLRHNNVDQQAAVNATDASDRFPTTPIPLAQLSTNSSSLQVQNAQSLSVNGQLNVNNSIVIAPTTRPNGAITGQLYYDRTTNQLSYYNGSSFQTILSGSLPATVGSIGGVSGDLTTGSGLGISGSTLRNTGVLTLQGESGDVTLAAGPGIVIDGTTLSSSGVLSLGGQGGNILIGSGLSLNGNTLSSTITNKVNSINGAGSISVTQDSNGNYTIGLAATPGTGTVTSSGTAATGTIAMFTGVQNIEQSLISQSGSTITVGGNLTVTGALSLSSPLSVAQGGTGVGTLPTNSVLIGNGTSATSGITGSNGQVLIINGAGVPSFTSFSGDVTVSGTGATTIQPNAVALGTDTTGNYVANIGATTGLTVGANTGEGSTPTLSVTYGNSANTAVQGNMQLTCPSGTGNLTGGGTVITLGTGGACGNLSTVNNPAFTTSVTTPVLQGAGLSVASTGANALTFGTNSNTRLTISSSGDLTATGNLALQGGSLGVGTATQGGSLVLSDGSSNNGTLEVSPLAQNVVYTLPDPSSGSATICLDSGNCAGAGGGVTASGTKTTNALTKFTGTGNAVTSSTITDDGTVVTTTVGLNVQGGTVTVGTSGQLGSLVLNDGSGGQTTTLQAGNSASNLTFVLPTTTGSSSNCLQKGSGNQLVWGNCTGSGGSGSVTSLDGMNGALTVVGTNHEVTVTDNSGAGTVTLSLPQAVDVTSAPSFGQLTVQSDQTTGDMLTVNNTDTGAPTGNLINLKLNGNSKLSVNSAGNILGGTYNGQTIGSSSSFTGDISVAGTLAVNTISPSSALTVGVSGQSFTLQGNASSVIKAVGGSGTATVAFQTPTANVTYRFAAAAANTYDICTTQGNCVGLGGGVTAPSGDTTGQLSLFTGSNQVGDSVISQSSGNIKIGTTLSHANLEVTGTTTLDTPLSVTSGGTGLSALTANEILLANGTGSSFAQLANGGNGSCLVIESGVPVFDTCTGAGGVSSINTKSGAVTLSGTTNQISITNPSGSAFTFSTPQNIDTGANVSFGSLATTNGISTGGTQRIDSSGNLSNIGSVTATGTIQGGGLTINNAGIITLNNLTGGASTCLTLDASNHVGTATCSTGTGTTPTLQNVYDNSNTTPLINLSSTGKGIFIQDASTTVGGNLFAVQNSTGGTKYLAVTTSGASVTGTLSVSNTINSTSGYLLNGTNINTNNTLSNVAYLGSATVNFTGTNLQHNGNAVCDASNNCSYLTTSAANGNYVQLAPGSVQASSSNSSLIFLNDTGTGNLVELQKAATDKFVVDNAGDVTASGTIQGAGLTINSGGTITLNNLTGGSSTCLTLNALNQVSTASCPTGSFLTSSTGIQLQASTPGTQQTGNFNISGTGLLATLDSTSTSLSLGTATATTINIGSTGSTTKGTTIHIGDTTSTANSQVVTLGSIAAISTNNTTIQGGSGPNAVSIQAANLGTINIASTNNNTLNIGTGLTTGGINIGSTGGSGAITLGGNTSTGGVILQGTNITQTLTGLASNPTDTVKGNSTSLFQIQNASSFAVLNVNTNANQVTLGTSSHVNGSLAFADNADSNTVSFTAAGGGVLNTSATGTGSGTLGALNPAGGGYINNYANTSVLSCSLFNFGSRQSATVTSITAYTGVGAGSGNNDYSMAIYTGTNGQPTTEIAATITGSISGTAGANTLSLTATLTANTQYWLCLNSDSSSAQWASSNNTTTGAWSIGQTFGTWPATITAGTGYYYQRAWDITLNYTLAGSTSTVETMNSTGQTTLQGVNNNGSAFQVQDTAGDNILNVTTGGAAQASVNINDSFLTLGGLSNPTGVSVALSNGGSLPANTQIDYYVDAVDAQGNHTQASDAALNHSNNWFTTGSGTTNRTATITWNTVPGAVSYTVYYSANFSSTYYSYSVPAGTTTLVDNGTVFSAAITNGTTASPVIYSNDTSGLTLQPSMSIRLDGANTNAHIGYTQYNQLLLDNEVSGGNITLQAYSLIYNDENTGDSVFTVNGNGATTLMTPTNTASAFVINNSSSTPLAALQVSTLNVSVSGANGNNAILKLGKDSGTNRSINATGSINQNGADYAEYFAQAIPGQLQPGDVTCITTNQKVEKCNGDPNSKLLGVVSSNAGLVGNDIFDASDPEGSAIISMLGQVPVKVSNANGAIQTGDMLTFDPATGLAVKATSASMTIGSALEDFTGATGTINVYIHIGYFDPMGLQSDGVSNGYVLQNGEATLSNLTLSGTATISTLNANTATIGTLTVSVALSTANITVNGHIVTGGGTPTIVTGTTAGAGAGVVVAGTDTSGKLTVTLGTGATTGDLADLTFHAPYSAAPNVTITAGDSNAAQMQQYVTPTATGFSLNAATSANLAPGQTYIFYYHVLQ